MFNHGLKRRTAGRAGVKKLAAVVGASAAAALGYLSIAVMPPMIGNAHIPQAGSGSAPVNTTYTQPVVGDMSMGNTATWTTPASVPQVSVASPAIKAGK